MAENGRSPRNGEYLRLSGDWMNGKGALQSVALLRQNLARSAPLVPLTGLNLVSAAILADIPSILKPDLVRKVATIINNRDSFIHLLQEPVRTIHPVNLQALFACGKELTVECMQNACGHYQALELLFPATSPEMALEIFAFLALEMNWHPTVSLVDKLASNLKTLGIESQDSIFAFTEGLSTTSH